MNYYCGESAFRDAGKITRDVITCAVSTGGHKYNAGFPEKLVEPFILALTAEGDRVIDPFAGTGVIGRLCEKKNRYSTLCDIKTSNRKAE